MNTIKYRSTCLIVFLLLFAGKISAQPAIKLGQPAPLLKVGEWLKGEPVTAFEKDKVYVIEFWATWCGWCIKAMPHLSELSEKYKGQAVFIGIDVAEVVPWGEDRDMLIRQKVEKFLEGEGKKMNYRVCLDTHDKYMEENWLTAQESVYGRPGKGIPFTVIIDGDNNVAWLGNPHDTLFDKVVEEVIYRRYDINDFISLNAANLKKINAANDEAEKLRKEAESSPVLDRINEAIKNGNYENALIQAYGALEKDPALNRFTYIPRLDAFKDLASTDPDKAFDLIQLEENRIAKVNDTVKLFLKDLAGTYGMMEGLPKRYYEFVIETLKDEHEARVLTYRWRKALGMAYYYLGNTEMAIEVYQRMSDRTRESGNDPADYDKAIEMFKAKGSSLK